MPKSTRQLARNNGVADGIHGLPCNPDKYKVSWHTSVEYLAGYLEGQALRFEPKRKSEID